MGNKNKIKNILVLTSWSYREGLIKSYTLPYLHRITPFLSSKSKIFLLTLEKENLFLSKEEAQKEKEILQAQQIDWKPFPYFNFGIKAMIYWMMMIPKLWFLIMFKGVSHIHCICTPAGMIGYILKKLTGKKLVIDSFEPHAASMLESGEWSKEGKAYKLLDKFEKLQSKAADTFIATTTGMYQYSIDHYDVTPSPFFVKPACVNLDSFSLDKKKDPVLVKKLGLEHKIVCVYVGKFGSFYWYEEIFRFIKVAQDFWGDRFRFLLLSNHSDDDISEKCQKHEINSGVVIREFVDHDDMPRFVGLGDFGLSPFMMLPSKKYCTPVKDGEYWAMGLPVIITKNISDDSDIISNHNAGFVLEDINEDEFLKALQHISTLLNEAGIEDRIRNVAIQYRSFEIADKVYKEVYG